MIGRVPDKGYCFPRTEFQLTQEWVADYVDAVEDSAIDAEVTPPMAVATQAIRILLPKCHCRRGRCTAVRTWSF